MPDAAAVDDACAARIKMLRRRNALAVTPEHSTDWAKTRWLCGSANRFSAMISRRTSGEESLNVAAIRLMAT